MTAFAPRAAGDAAPECALACDDGRQRRLSEFRGSPVVLVFHPPHWDPAQTEYVAMFNRFIAGLPGFAGAHLVSVGGAPGPWHRLTFDDGSMSILARAGTSTPSSPNTSFP